MAGFSRWAREWRLFKQLIKEPSPDHHAFLLACMASGAEGRSAAINLKRSSHKRQFFSSIFVQQASALFAGVQEPYCAVRPSSIPNSGNGLFCTAPVAPGHVLAWYPGAAYAGQSQPLVGAFSDVLGADLDEMPTLLRPPSDSLYVLARPDGIRLDAGAVASGQGLARVLARNPHAYAHIVQHAPAGQEPCVMEVCLDVEVELNDSRTAGAVRSGSNSRSSGGGSFTGGLHPHPQPQPQPLPLPLAVGEQLPYWWPPEPVLSSPLPPAWQDHPLISRRRVSSNDNSSSRSGNAGSSAGGVGEVEVPVPVVRIPAVVFISTRRIEPGEELFFDYGFLPRGEVDMPVVEPEAPAAGHTAASAAAAPATAAAATATAGPGAAGASSGGKPAVRQKKVYLGVPPWYTPVPPEVRLRAVNRAEAALGLPLSP